MRSRLVQKRRAPIRATLRPAGWMTIGANSLNLRGAPALRLQSARGQGQAGLEAASRPRQELERAPVEGCHPIGDREPQPGPRAAAAGLVAASKGFLEPL